MAENSIENTLLSRDSLKRRLIEGDKKKFQKYVDSTTTHGVKHIFNGKSIIRRVFWGLLFLGMLTGCLYGVISSIIAFAKVPTSTTVYTDHVSELTFPAVTICNLNGYNITYLNENNLTDIISFAIFQERDKNDDISQQCAAYVPPSYSVENISLYETINQTSQPLEALIVDCHFLGKPCDRKSSFIEYITPTGKCFTFNGRNVEKDYLTVNGSGFRHDLELLINVEQDTFTGSVNGEVGVLVSVHEQDTPALVWESGINVPVGHSAYLAVRQEQIEDRTDRPNTKELECIHPSDAVPFKLFTTYDYSFRSCRGECITKDLVDSCDCLWTNEQRSDYRNCNITDLCCIYNVRLKYTKDCSCPVLCNHSSYDVVPSYATFPSHKTAKEIARRINVNEEQLHNDFLKVHVFFESLSIHREITERSYSLAELIANIGGNMGLFLGASIISLTEFLTLIFDQIKDRLFGIREKKLRRSVDSFLVKKRNLDKSYNPQYDEKENSSNEYFVTANYEDFNNKNHVNLNDGNSEE